MKKTVYLIRHGETAYNRKQVHQYLAVSLSPQGEKQAERVAGSIERLNIDALVSSDITRARQTAEYIGKATGKEIVFEPLFREMIRPSSILGKSFFDPRAIYVFSMLYMMATDLHWHYDDEENFAEFRDRAHKAIEFLEEYDAERIAVVTHRIFIGAFLAELECKFACSMGRFVRESIRLGHIKNTGITTLTFDSEREEPWQLERANDTSHFGRL